VSLLSGFLKTVLSLALKLFWSVLWGIKILSIVEHLGDGVTPITIAPLSATEAVDSFFQAVDLPPTT
jgi:hypothetical protein